MCFKVPDATRTTTYIADHHVCRRDHPRCHGGRRCRWSYLYLTLMSLHAAYYFFTKSISSICRRRFADVPACSDVADFRCLMCTSAELHREGSEKECAVCFLACNQFYITLHINSILCAAYASHIGQALCTNFCIIALGTFVNNAMRLIE